MQRKGLLRLVEKTALKVSLLLLPPPYTLFWTHKHEYYYDHITTMAIISTITSIGGIALYA